MVGKGQPPKKPEDKRVPFNFRLSQKEKEIIEEGRDIEAPEKGTSAYIRESAIERAEKAIKEIKK
ncbi:MAG: hypothetical protein Q4F84_05565 [Fibrobacter sp.]|nr:hypothetical protein [Fibrobacter sp.]